MRKAIKNSPGYTITRCGKVYNKDGVRLKTWYSHDGYERIELFSLKHGKYVNRTIHLLVACEFLKQGIYHDPETKLQINHIDGNKKNNCVKNLEAVTGTQNVNHAHDHGLYTYNLKIRIRDIKEHKYISFRSLRELARYLKVSVNFIRIRIIISKIYPVFSRYIFYIDTENYLKHVSTIKNNEKIYVHDHVCSVDKILTSYTQIPILLGISDSLVLRGIKKSDTNTFYIGGYTYSTNSEYLTNGVDKDIALVDRSVIWKKIAMNDNKERRA